MCVVGTASRAACPESFPWTTCQAGACDNLTNAPRCKAASESLPALSPGLEQIYQQALRCVEQPAHLRHYVEPGTFVRDRLLEVEYTTPATPMVERYCQTSSETETKLFIHLFKHCARDAHWSHPWTVHTMRAAPDYDPDRPSFRGFWLRSKADTPDADIAAYLTYMQAYLSDMGSGWMRESGSRVTLLVKREFLQLPYIDTDRRLEDRRLFVTNIMVIAGLLPADHENENGERLLLSDLVQFWTKQFFSLPLHVKHSSKGFIRGCCVYANIDGKIGQGYSSRLPKEKGLHLAQQ